MPETLVTRRSIYSWVLGGNAKYQILLLGLVLATVAARVFPLEMQKRIVNQAIGMGDLNKLFLYSALFFAGTFLAQILKYAINLIQGHIGQSALALLREKLFEHLTRLPLSFFRRTSPGSVISSMVTELSGFGDFAGQSISLPLVNILTFLAFGGYMFYQSPILAAISVSIYPIDALILPQIQKRFNRVNRERAAQQREMSGMLGESVSGIQELHANASYALESGKFSRLARKMYRTAFKLNALKWGAKFANNFFQSLGPLILFLVGGYLAIRGRFDLGSLVAFLSAYEKLYDPWKELLDFYQLFQDSRLRYGQVMDQFDALPEYTLAPEGREPYAFTGRVDIQDLTYLVGGNIRILDRVSLSLKPGEHLALVGFSGSGKTTLALCVGQLYSYTGGSVRLDGREVAELTRLDMSSNVAMVAQRPFIFSGTVRDNLLYSCEALNTQGGHCEAGKNVTLDRLIETVQQVGLFLDILRFGLQQTLEPSAHPGIEGRLLQARRTLYERHGQELEKDVEFFRAGAFLEYGSLAMNIVFGAPVDKAYSLERLHQNREFLEFLARAGFWERGLDLAAEIASRTVDVVKSVGAGPEMFENTPMPADELDVYTGILDRLRSRRPADLTRGDQKKLIKIALRFNPGRHTLARLDERDKKAILKARAAFKEHIEARHPGAINFYGRGDYLHTQSIQENILHGLVRTDRAGAEERVSRRIMRILIEENVLEQVLEIGFRFDVGSQGDRLSGGQRQKIALARALLKDSPIVILDEATSSLDNASQARIQNIIHSKWGGRSTVISVVHRLDTLKNYDLVAVLKAGRIQETGAYEELIAKKGALYDLVHGSK